MEENKTDKQLSEQPFLLKELTKQGNHHHFLKLEAMMAPKKNRLILLDHSCLYIKQPDEIIEWDNHYLREVMLEGI